MDSICGYISPILPTPVYSLVMFNCIKCNHQWFQRSLIPPRRCPNHSCRSTRWNSSVPFEAIKEPEPVKPVELDDLRNIIKSIESKPKSDYYEKSIVPPYQPDRNDPYSETTYSWD